MNNKNRKTFISKQCFGLKGNRNPRGFYPLFNHKIIEK